MDGTISYRLPLNLVDRGRATFEGESAGAPVVLHLPRDHWEELGRPGQIVILVEVS